MPTGNVIIDGLDRLAGAIVDKLQELFGFEFSRNAEHYVYVATFATGTADASGTSYSPSFRTTQESDFICTRLQGTTRISSGTGTGNLIGTSTNAGAAGDWPDCPYSLQIVDGSSDRQLHSAPVDVFGAYGTHGGQPGVFARPRLFARNTVVSMAAISFKAVPSSTQWTTRLHFVGWKIYDARALDLTSRAV